MVSVQPVSLGKSRQSATLRVTGRRRCVQVAADAARLGWAGNDRKRSEAAQHQAVAVTPVQVLDRNGQAELGEAVQQRAERELAFHAGQRRAEAEVDAVAEREVPHVRSIDVEHLRLRRSATASRFAAASEMITCAPAGMVMPPTRHRLDGVAERRVRHRARRSGAAPRRRRRAGPVGAQGASWSGWRSRATTPLPIKAGGRVVARHDQLEDRRQQLLLGEPLVAVAGLEQPGDEVVAGSLLLGLDERAQHRHDRVGRRLRSVRTPPGVDVGREQCRQLSPQFGHGPVRARRAARR